MMYYALGIIVMVLFGLTSVEIIGRFVFNHSLPWIAEVCENLLIWLVFLGATEVTRRNAHLTAGVSINNVLPPRAQLWLKLFVNTCVCITIGIIGYYGSIVAYSSSHIVAPASQIPMWCVWVAIPVNFGLMIFYMMRENVRMWRGEKILAGTTMIDEEDQ